MKVIRWCLLTADVAPHTGKTIKSRKKNIFEREENLLLANSRITLKSYNLHLCQSS